MAMGSVDYKAVLTDLEARKTQLEAVIAGVKAILASGGGVMINGHSEGVVRPEDIPSHAFLGLSIADATKKFLSMVKSKQSLPAIMQALERGGLPPAKYNTVYAVLRRRENQYEDIFRMGEDWALTEWYPNNPNIRKRPAKSKPEAPQEQPARPKRAGAKRAPRAKGGITLADGAAKILKDAGTPLHLNDIMAKLAEMGRETSANVLRDVFTRKDHEKRFKVLGKNMFDLADTPEAEGS